MSERGKGAYDTFCPVWYKCPVATAESASKVMVPVILVFPFSYGRHSNQAIA